MPFAMPIKAFTLVSTTTLLAAAFFITPQQSFGQDGANSLEEIVVTATRREESLQSVPISINAFDSEDLELRNITNTDDLQILVPNVDIRGGAGGPLNVGTASIRIRGLESVRYMDGIPMGAGGDFGGLGGLRNVAELERIEVLKGPQGTLFGKNALGGAIQYISKRPADVFGARVKLSVGSNSNEIIANVDIPLSDTVKTKFTAVSDNREGYVTSIVTGEKYGQTDNTTVRGVLDWQPIDSFNAVLAVQNDRTDGNGQAQVIFGVDNTNPEIIAYNALGLGVTFSDAGLNFGDREQYFNAMTERGVQLNDATLVSLHTNWQINESVALKTISSIRELESGQSIDADGAGLFKEDRWQYYELEELTQEIQLLGGSDRFDWIVGAYYGTNELKRHDVDWEAYEATLGTPAEDFTNNLIGQDKRDSALFGEFGWNMTEKLRLIFGARYSKEKYTSDTYDPADTNIPVGALLFNVNGSINDSRSDSYSDTTYRAVLQYQLSDDKMVYTNVSSGFNSGGFSEVEEGGNSFLPETVTNYEIGFRSEWLDKRVRLNLSAFKIDHEDIQIGQFNTTGFPPFFSVQVPTINAGTAEIEGFEMDTVIQVGENLTLNASVGILDGKYTEVPDSVGFIPIQTVLIDNDLIFLPELTYSVGLQHDTTLSGGGSLTSRLDYGWTDDVEDSTGNAQIPSRANGLQNDDNSYGLLNGRIAYSPSDGNWEVALWSKNLLDEYYQVAVFSQPMDIDPGVPGRPREIGISFSADF